MNCLVLDLGTTSSKCSLWYGGSGALPESVLGTEARHSIVNDPNILIDVVESCLDDFERLFSSSHVQTRRNFMDVSALAFSTFGMNLVGLNNEQKIAAYATYRGDLFLNGHCIDAFDPNDLPAKLFLNPDDLGVPQPLHPSLALLHLIQTRRSPSISVVRWTTVLNLCLERWTGQQTVSLSMSEASWWGMLNYRTADWDSTAILASGYPVSAFPPIATQPYLDARFLPRFASRWPSLANTRIYLPVVDGACAAIGSSPVGEIGCTIGTSAAMRIVVSSQDGFQAAQRPVGCFLYLISRELAVIGGALTDGGNSVDIVSNLTGLPSNKDFENDPLPSNIVCLPFFSASGERAPGWAGTDIPSAFVGLNGATTRDQLIMATACAVAIRLAMIAEMLPSKKSQRIFISGTALARSSLWQRTIRAASNRDLWSLKEPSKHGEQDHVEVRKDDVTSRGAAMLAMGITAQNEEWCERSIGAFPGHENMLEEDKRVLAHLRAKQTELYQRLFKFYLSAL